jgi:hypothetical protein
VFFRDQSKYTFLREVKIGLASIDVLVKQGHEIVGMEFPGDSSYTDATLYRVWYSTPVYPELPPDAIDPDNIVPGKLSRSYVTDEPYFPGDLQPA